MDKAGYPNAKIYLSNGLDEYLIEELIKEGTIVDSFDVNDNIKSNDKLGGVYKLVAVKENEKYVTRVRTDDEESKTINPGFKRLYRIYDNDGKAISDIITLYNEELILNDNNNDNKIRELKEPIFINGRQVFEKRSVEERKKYCKQEINTISDCITTIDNPQKYDVYLSKKILKLKGEIITPNSVNELKQINKEIKEIKNKSEELEKYYCSEKELEKYKHISTESLLKLVHIHKSEKNAAFKILCSVDPFQNSHECWNYFTKWGYTKEELTHNEFESEEELKDLEEKIAIVNGLSEEEKDNYTKIIDNFKKLKRKKFIAQIQELESKTNKYKERINRYDERLYRISKGIHRLWS